MHVPFLLWFVNPLGSAKTSIQRDVALNWNLDRSEGSVGFGLERVLEGLCLTPYLQRTRFIRDLIGRNFYPNLSGQIHGFDGLEICEPLDKF